jgi:hypothetical protein
MMAGFLFPVDRGITLIPLLNRSTGDGAECDDVGAEADDDGVGATGVLGLASDAKSLVYLLLQQNWSN